MRSSSETLSNNLDVQESGKVGSDVKEDPIDGTVQCHASDKEDSQDDVGKEGGEVDSLDKMKRINYPSNAILARKRKANDATAVADKKGSQGTSR